jgi:CRP/FNR family transcriptional regulator, anaerobic regulatory protein
MLNNQIFENLIQAIKAIADLPEGEIHVFLSSIEVKEVAKGAHIIQGGDVCDFICFVDKGLLRTYLMVDDQEINTEFFHENTFAAAYTSFLLNTKTALNIQALELSTLLYISKQNIEVLYTRDPRWLALGKHIFEREFIKKCKRESSLLQESAKERYLTLLRDVPGIETRVPLFHIASYLGIKPESLSRIRSAPISN